MGQSLSTEKFMILVIRDEADRELEMLTATKYDDDDDDGECSLRDNHSIRGILSGNDSSILYTTELSCRSHVHIYKRDDEVNMKCMCGDGVELIFPDVSFLQELGSLEMLFRVRPSDGILSLSKINFSSTIKELSLRLSGLPWEKMSIIGKLPNLHALTLIHDSFEGEVWVTKDGEFRKLKYLTVGFTNLRLWISYREHLPSLECLVLKHCCLHEIPSDLGYIPTLQRMEVEDCWGGHRLALSAIQIEDEQRQYGNDKLQVVVTDKSGEMSKDQLKLDHAEGAFQSSYSMLDLLSCLEECFQSGGSQGFIDKLTIIDQKQESTTTDVDDPLLFWSRESFSLFLCYVRQFCSVEQKRVLSDMINSLYRIAEAYVKIKLLLPGYQCYVDEINKKGREFTELLECSFIPHVSGFFQLPKPQQNNLKRNEILAAYMNFLVQMLFCLGNTNSAEEHQYALLRKELSFILSVLGDTPFQPTHPRLVEQTNNLLADFEILGNEAGCFVYSCVFPIHPIKVSWCYAETAVLIEKTKLLSAKIEEHCNTFLELPMAVVSGSGFIDSIIIVDSLIHDVQNVMSSRQVGSFTPDDTIMDQLERLNCELKHLQNVITDFQVSRYTSTKEAKETLIQIRDLAYEGEYLISSHVVGNIPVWYLNLRLPSVVQKIKAVNDRLQHMKEMHDTKAMKGYDGEVSFRIMGNPTNIDDNQFVDFNVDITRKILKDLIGKPKTPRETILIFGMPGLGKTTAATKLYNCKAASVHFDRRAWTVVSQMYSVRTVSIQILIDLGCEEDVDSISGKKVAELGVLIHKTLKQRRYLIVLDDVWCSDVWDDLQRYFPDDGNGSRVVITSRNKDVAPTGSIFHKLPFLSDDQCWDLIEKKVFQKDLCPPHLLSIGKRIAKRCSGVPLAVVNMAGLLANLEIEESVWERVEKELDALLLDDQRDYRKIMELSYEHLPKNLKPCFLYFASYPEDAEISKKEVTWYWIAEGFIQKDGTKSLEEIAEAYLLDLINRSLVMTAKRSSDGGLKTCRIHDLLHDICLRKANEENFLKSTNMFTIYEKHRHLSVPSSSGTLWIPFGLHCRSIRGWHTDQSPCFRTMSLLKTLKLNGDRHSLYQRFDLPVQLRYLGIRDLPIGMVANLVNLEFIHVMSNSKVSVPAGVLTMVKLKHLLVKPEAEFEGDCNITETTNLRSLSCIRIYRKEDEEVLRYSPHLQTLKCICGGETAFPDLCFLAELESLNMDFETHLSGETALSKINFPSAIKKLTLSRSGLPWEKMSIIGKLPNLHVLKLEQYAFEGEVWVTNDEEFQELRYLKIESGGLKQWISDSDHFPSLEQLVLYSCYGLQEIPGDLGYIPTLRRIEIKGCSKSATLSAIQIEQEQRENGNELLVEIPHDD